jgi:uncharacterized protein
MSRFSKTFIRLFLATGLIGPTAQVSNAQAISRETSITKLREGAEAGNADAQLQLGLAYQEGKGVTQSYAEAARWFRKAAAAGYDPAQCVLGVAYQAGKGVAQDYAEAARWFRKAAQSGNADGGLLLGLAYKDGKGATQDYAEAARWFRKAAETGYAPAQCALGLAYQEGEGVPQNYVLAHMWTNLCASDSSGDDQQVYAKFRDVIAQEMTPQQIAEAQRMAAEWKPKK